MKFFIAEGNSGKTYGIKTDENIYIQIQYQSGSLGKVQELESFESWAGRFNVQETNPNEIPKELYEIVNCTG